MSIVVPISMTDRPCQHGVQIPDYICVHCGGRGPGDAVVSWVVRSVFGFPMRAMHIVTRYRCWSCGGVVDRAGGNFGAPPRLHRHGAAIFLLVSLSVVFLVAWSMFPHSSGIGGPSARDQAMLSRIVVTAEASAAEFGRRSAACLARWRGVVAKTFPRGLLDNRVAEVELAPGVNWWSQPVLPVREAADDLAGLYPLDTDGPRPLPCDLRLLETERVPDRRMFEYLGVKGAQKRLEELEATLRRNIEVKEMGVVDWACARRVCKIAMAVVDAEGRVLGLKRHEEPWKDKTMGAADLRWGLHQRLKGLSEKDPFAK